MSLYVAKSIRPNSSAKAATVRLLWIFSILVGQRAVKGRLVFGIRVLAGFGIG